LPEILHRAAADETPRRLAVPTAMLDPATEQVVAERIAQAAEEAWRDGYEKGNTDGRAAVNATTTTLRTHLGQMLTELRSQREVATAVHIDVARSLATAVLGATPPDSANTVLTRIGDALALIDDTVTVYLHPDDAAAVGTAISDDNVTVATDSRLGLGEVRINGLHGGAQLTREQLLNAAAEAWSASGSDVGADAAATGEVPS